MQPVRFIKEGMRHYMVVPCSDIVEETYRSMVLQHIEVPYFMRYEVREFNGIQALYYQLKYHTTMKAVMEHLPFTKEQVKNMICSFIGVLEVADDYILYYEDIIWKMDRIFIEVDTGKLQFCYNPIRGKDNGNLKDLLSELIEVAGKKNHDAVGELLEFYNLVSNPECTTDQLIQYRENKLGQTGSIYPARKIIPESFFIKDNEKKEEPFAEEFEGKEESKWVPVARGMLIMLAVVNMLLIMGLLFNILSYHYIKYLIIGMIILIVMTIFYTQMVKKDESMDEIMQAYFESLPESKQENVFKNNETTILNREIVVEDRQKELYLVSLQKDRNPPVYILENSIILGSMEESCDYILKEGGVSRMHAKLIKKETGLYVADLNSTNGTYLNGKLIESGVDYQLKEGDKIAFANTEFLVAEK